MPTQMFWSWVFIFDKTLQVTHMYAEVWELLVCNFGGRNGCSMSHKSVWFCPYCGGFMRSFMSPHFKRTDFAVSLSSFITLLRSTPSLITNSYYKKQDDAVWAQILGLWGHIAPVQILARPLPSCVKQMYSWTSLRLIFFICKMGTVPEYLLLGWLWGLHELLHGKHFVYCLSHWKPSICVCY